MLERPRLAAFWRDTAITVRQEPPVHLAILDAKGFPQLLALAVLGFRGGRFS